MVVRIVGMRFVPQELTVKPGTTVIWENGPDGPSHQVTTDADQAMDANDVALPGGAVPFDSGKIKPGKSYRYQFKVPGTYRYACPPHEMHGMVGKIVVEP